MNFEKIDRWIEKQTNTKPHTIRIPIPDYQKFKLEIGPRGRKTIRLYTSRRGKAQYILLGEHPYISFEKAWELGIKRINERAEGKAPRPAYSFEAVWEKFMSYAEEVMKLKPTTLKGYRIRANAHILPVFGSTPLEEIDLDTIKNSIFVRYEAQPNINVRLFYMLMNFFKFAKKRGYVLDDPLELFVFSRNFATPSRKTHYDKIVNPVDLTKFIENVCQSSISHKRKVFVVFGLMTALRSMNLLDLRESDIDFERKLLKISRSRMKGEKRTEAERQDFVLPLSDTAIALLKSITPQNGKYFVGFGVTPMNERLREFGGITRHGLRGTFKTFSAKNMRAHGLPNYVIEMYMSHQPSMSEVEMAYSELRYDDHEIQDMLRELAEWWEGYILNLFDFREVLGISCS